MAFDWSANIFFQHNPALSCVLEASGELLAVNLRWQLLGYPSLELIDSWLGLFHPADQTLAAQTLQQVIETQHVQSFHGRLRRASGDYQSVLWQVNWQEEIAHILCVGFEQNDVIKTGNHLLAVENLNTQLKLFKTIVDISKIAVEIWYIEGQYVYTNAAHQLLFKYNADDLAHLNQNSYYSPEAYRCLLEEILPCLSEHIFWEGELLMQEPSGRLFNTRARFELVTDDEHRQSSFVVGMMRDISEHQALQDALRYEHHQYETIFHAAPLAILYKDDQNRIIRANRYAAELLETTPDRLMGMSMYDLSPDQGELHYEEDLSVIHTGQSILSRVEEFYERQWSVSKIPYYDSDNKIIGVISFAIDLTEQVSKEHQLKYELDKYKTVFQAAPVAIMFKDKQGKIESANYQASAMISRALGQPLSPEMLIGRYDYDLFPKYTEQYRADDLISINSGQPRLGTIGEYPRGYLQNDRIPYRDEKNHVIGVISFAQDITRQVRAQHALQERAESLRVSLECLPIMLCVFDDQGQVVLWNKECERVTGYSAATVLHNASAFDLLFPDAAYRDEVIQTARLMIERYDGFRNWECIMTCRDGSEKTIAWSVSTEVKLADFALWLVGQDVTEHQHTLEQVLLNEERFRAVVENMPIMLNAYNASGEFVVWNRECEKVTGYLSADIVRRKDALMLLYPKMEYREEVRRRLFNEDTCVHYETEVTCKDGTHRIISWSNVSRHYPIFGWYGWMIGEDVTSLKKIEKIFNSHDSLLSRALDGVKTSIAITDGSGRFIYVNRAWAKLFDYAVEDLLDRHFNTILPSHLHGVFLSHYFSFFLNLNSNNHFSKLDQAITVNKKILATIFTGSLVKMQDTAQAYVAWTLELQP
ncbi:PAS domain S-box protein [Thioflexithrix psekupsensis]|uniref:PAS domain S-box protein n=1 Tax=Thioflexithrix psekupsensis TaxID=1570016 RepID=A0A251X746_9GAMM|nr:PAS domain S-box protein [Thioflexithrix psekupsensis]OUD13291.1 hypothetical protein TPSD3_11720 [Thioflexithrix psekupsensis]